MTDLTDGQRIYAIGDIHGNLQLLSEVRQRIDLDLVARPHGSPLVICLGDYGDRGPDTRGVIAALIDMQADALPSRFLLGNHDNYIHEFLADPRFQDIHLHWLNPRMGGDTTLMSYGVPASVLDDLDAARDAFAAGIPKAHLDFLATCQLSLSIGGYIFAHAGIRPGVALADQVKEDLIWIREPFLSHSGDLGGKVVHGHTIVDQVEHHTNRIAIDTGAYRTGELACLVLEGANVSLLGPSGLQDYPEGRGVSAG